MRYLPSVVGLAWSPERCLCPWSCSGTPRFDSYVIPGLLLGVVIGGSALGGAIALLAHAKRSRLISAAAGVVMVGWIAGETILVEGFSWLQGLYLLTGLLVVVGAWYLRVVAHAPEASPRRPVSQVTR